MTELLLTFSADPKVIDSDGQTALDLALNAGHAEVLAVLSHRYLLRHGQRMDTTPASVVVPAWKSTGEIEGAFRRYDPDQTGTVPASALGDLARDLGQPMSLTEVKEMALALQSTAPAGPGGPAVTFSDFVAFWIGD